MKIRKLIETLLEDHELDDEIIVDWFSKKFLTDWLDCGELDYTDQEFNKAWLAIQEKGQEEMGEALSHYGAVYEIRDLILDEIVEARKENA